MATQMSERARARLDLVEAHIRSENAHDLDGIMATFGEDATYEEEAWAEEHRGWDAVRDYYQALMTAMPDIFIDVERRHVTDDHVILEVTIRGTHLGHWRGLPATGRRVEFPLCAVYMFTDNDRLAGERIYYDRATVLRQLGVYHEPSTLVGRVTTAVNHPLTLARAYTRQLLGR